MEAVYLLTLLDKLVRVSRSEILVCVVAVQLPSHVWLLDPMNCSIPGFPVPHHLLEFAQVHVHWISDAVQPSHPVTLFSCLQSHPASGSFPKTCVYLQSNSLWHSDFSLFFYFCDLSFLVVSYYQPISKSSLQLLSLSFYLQHHHLMYQPFSIPYQPSADFTKNNSPLYTLTSMHFGTSRMASSSACYLYSLCFRFLPESDDGIPPSTKQCPDL